MLDRSQIFNYVTLILAFCTICFSVLSIITKFTPIVSVILMLIMLVVNNLSKKINQKENIEATGKESVVSNINIKSEEK